MELIAQLPSFLQEWQQTLQWQPDAEQQRLLQQLYEGILQGNQQVNLTRITNPDEFWEKHLWDSLYGVMPWLSENNLVLPAECLPQVQTVIDIGTGGGFPGLPVAIALSSWQVTCLDSTRKKIAFLAGLSQSLGLSRVYTLAERAEAVGHDPLHRQAYDLALIRAVGPATVCAEYALPLVKVGGMVVLYRGQWTPEEEKALKQAVSQLGGEQVWVQAATTPLSYSARHCIYIHKVSPTAEEFPRAPGIPTKQPLA
ncbi:MAG TPA: 16S rRNA (guanine(527)-N(7))-methyltransferase RsmG [Trichocoleus sp.]